AFVVACLLVVAADLVSLHLGFVTLLTAAIVVGVGECLHTTVLIPLVADLAPAALRGRYMAATGLSWWLGLAGAPTLGAQALSAAGGVALAGGFSALSLERELPDAIRRTPRPETPRTTRSLSPVGDVP